MQNIKPKRSESFAASPSITSTPRKNLEHAKTMILEQLMSSRKLKAGKVQDHLADDAIDSASESTG